MRAPPITPHNGSPSNTTGMSGGSGGKFPSHKSPSGVRGGSGHRRPLLMFVALGLSFVCISLFLFDMFHSGLSSPAASHHDNKDKNALSELRDKLQRDDDVVEAIEHDQRVNNDARNQKQQEEDRSAEKKESVQSEVVPPPPTFKGEEKTSSPTTIAESTKKAASNADGNKKKARWVPPACRHKGPSRVNALPTCMMPALNTKRPRVVYMKSPSALNMNKGQSSVAERYDREHYKYPLGLTYFRPPFYGQAGLTLNGSMTAEDFFVPYDEKEWDMYCDALGNSYGDGGDDEDAPLSGLGAMGLDGKDKRRGLVIPDKVVIGTLHNEGSWEEETIIGQLVPPLFMMDRTKGGTVKPNNNQHGEESDYPLVFIMLLRYSAFAAWAPISIAELVATVQCLRRHLAMWYDEDTLNEVFFNHERTQGFVEVNDRTANLGRLKELFALYEGARHGDLTAYGYMPHQNHIDLVDLNDQCRLYDPSNLTAVALKRPIEAGETPEKAHRREFIPHRPEEEQQMTNLQKPFVLPRITTIYSTSDEYAHNEPTAQWFAKWVWGGEIGPIGAKPTTGRVYMRQYSHNTLTNITLMERKTINQIMLSFRHFAKGIMTRGRVEGTERSVGYWGGAPSPTSSSPHQRQQKDVKLLNRDYLWSFFGELKRDRKLMRNAMTNLSTSLGMPFACCNNTEIEHFYTRSMFVPVGRGFIILDCSRVYEGAAAGAIPILVSGRFEEIIENFGTFAGGGPFSSPDDLVGYDDFNATRRAKLPLLPPFVFAESWPKAALVVEALLQQPSVLEKKRQDCIQWFLNSYWFMQESLIYPSIKNQFD